jgi:hypothetical protein
MRKEYKEISVKDQERIRNLEALRDSDGWKTLNELIMLNDVKHLEAELLTGEDLLDASSLDKIISHSFKIRWTQAKINMLKNLVSFPENFIALMSDDPNRTENTDPFSDNETEQIESSEEEISTDDL